mmetsp:Transcript_14412/g.36890  ORF Transcript_14412/g.36890 Transcript_14412/m.36890 type:complete len:186 (+) Transcript_14412:298-855(+)
MERAVRQGAERAKAWANLSAYPRTSTRGTETQPGVISRSGHQAAPSHDRRVAAARYTNAVLSSLLVPVIVSDAMTRVPAQLLPDGEICVVPLVPPVAVLRLPRLTRLSVRAAAPSCSGAPLRYGCVSSSSAVYRWHGSLCIMALMNSTVELEGWRDFDRCAFQVGAGKPEEMAALTASVERSFGW